MRGVPTLWCSFELKNEVILATMIRQLSGSELSDSSESFDFWADQLERLPMYFQTFYGSTDVRKVLNIIEYSIYAYDVTHIILDNLQFMLSGQGKGFERFELQDDLISKLRTIATEKNIHITLVIHPKKTDDGQDLTIGSIFGTSKATQEADNIMLIQNRSCFKMMDIKKNRYDGEVGRVAMLFDKNSKKFETINKSDIESLMNGVNPVEILKNKQSVNLLDSAKIIEKMDFQNLEMNKIPVFEKISLCVNEYGSDVIKSIEQRINENKSQQELNFQSEKPSINQQNLDFVKASKIEKEIIQKINSNGKFLVDKEKIVDVDLPNFDQLFFNNGDNKNDNGNLNIENCEIDDLDLNSQEEIVKSTEKWNVDQQSGVNFYVEKGTIMTYDDIISDLKTQNKPKYVNKPKVVDRYFEDEYIEQMNRNK